MIERRDILALIPPVIAGGMGALVFALFMLNEPASTSLELYRELVIAMAVFLMFMALIHMDAVTDKIRIRNERDEVLEHD